MAATTGVKRALAKHGPTEIELSRIPTLREASAATMSSSSTRDAPNTGGEVAGEQETPRASLSQADTQVDGGREGWIVVGAATMIVRSLERRFVVPQS